MNVKLIKWDNIILGIMCIYIFVLIFEFIDKSCYDVFYMNSADFFYNYAAGFIRRGLLGEIIIRLNYDYGVDATTFIQSFCIINYVLLCLYFIWQFTKNKYNWYLLTTCFMLGAAAVYDLAGLRRDPFLFLLLILLFHSYNKFKSIWVWILIGNIICSLALLCHEAFFFYSIPILCLITRVKLHSWFKSILYWSPSITIFLIACINRGNPEELIAIWQYAQPAYMDGHQTQIPYLLTFIGVGGRSVP